MTIMITLNKIRAASPSTRFWKKVLKHHEYLGMDTEFPLSDLLDSNCLSDTLWCFKALPEHIDIPKRFALWCARQVQHLMTDERSIRALDVAERYLDGNATLEQLNSAKHDAYDAYVANAAYAYAAYAAIAAAAAYVAVSAAAYAVYAADMGQKQIDKLREMLKCQ